MKISKILRTFFDIIFEIIAGMAAGYLLAKAVNAKSLNWPVIVILAAIGLIDTICFVISVFNRVRK